jgi:hypothetical protein
MADGDVATINPPWRLDPLQNIVNISWGVDVIVVFVTGSIYKCESAGFDVVTDTNNNPAAEYLGAWNSPYIPDPDPDLTPIFPSVAYRVASGAGEFITSTAPAVGDTGYNEFWIDCAVFAIDGSADDSGLQRAIDGTRLIESYSDNAPPGLLWLVDAPSMREGTTIRWKVRHGPHRLDDFTDPPNSMTQVYPLGPSYNSTPEYGTTWFGYVLYAYRLDADGLGTAYSEIVSGEAGVRQDVPPEWNAQISENVAGAPVLGIPFQDPPPYITEDLITEQ